MVNEKRTGATMEWAQFTAEKIALTHLMTLLVQFPALVKTLPDVVQELAKRGCNELPQATIDELRSRAAQFKDLKLFEGFEHFGAKSS